MNKNSELIELKYTENNKYTNLNNSKVIFSNDGKRMIVSSFISIKGKEDSLHERDVVGVVTVYVLKDNQWIEEAVLTPNNIKSVHNGYFGLNLSINKTCTVLMVTAHLTNVKANDDPNDKTKLYSAGCIYVFARTDSNWILRDTLTLKDKRAKDNFGETAALSGDGSTIAVLTPRHLKLDSLITVFKYRNNEWVELPSIEKPIRNTNIEFGGCLRLSTVGNRLFVSSKGVYYEEDMREKTGIYVVDIFERSIKISYHISNVFLDSRYLGSILETDSIGTRLLIEGYDYIPERPVLELCIYIAELINNKWTVIKYKPPKTTNSFVHYYYHGSFFTNSTCTILYVPVFDRKVNKRGIAIINLTIKGWVEKSISIIDSVDMKGYMNNTLILSKFVPISETEKVLLYTFSNSKDRLYQGVFKNES